MRRYASIEVARGLAACSVVLFHVAVQLGQSAIPAAGAPVQIGRVPALLGSLNAGVAVFFAISGFVIGRPIIAAYLAGEAWDARRYAVRRLVRILPAYWVALTLLAIYPGLPGVFTDDWWRYYFLLQIYGITTISGLGPAWTLCIEMSFYLALPVLVLGLCRVWVPATVEARATRLLVVFTTLAAVSVSYGWWRANLSVSPNFEERSMYTLLGTFAWFLPGLALAVCVDAPGHPLSALLRRLDRVRGVAVLCLIGLGGSLLGLAFAHRDLQDLVGSTVAQAGIATFGLALAFVLRDSVRGRIGAIGVWLGTVSYGIYLWHQPIAKVLCEDVFDYARHEGLRTVGFAFLVVLAVSAAIAWVSWRLLEAPLLGRASAWLRRREAPSTVADPAITRG